MPSQDDERTRLEQIRDRPRRRTDPRAEPASVPPAEEVKPPPPPKRESLRVAREGLKHAAESPWVKLVVALVVGGAGGEVHRTVKALDVATKTELEAEKKRSEAEVLRLEKRIDALALAEQKTKDDAAQDHRTLYLTSRYLYFVLPKLGVLVTLPPGAELHKMDFHPAPVPRGPLGPNDAKPIQPAETLPLPPER